MTKEQEIERGRQAAAVLENPAYQAALDALETEYVRAWRDSPAPDAEGRERLFVALQVSRDFATHLNSMLVSGKISAQQIARLKTPK
jgi:hypothetical protein